MLAPITSIKHYVQDSVTTIGTGGVLNTTIAEAVIAPAASATSDVAEGSVIKAIYIESWLHSQATAGGGTQQNFCIMKIPAEATVPTAANLLNLQSYTNKKNIMFSSQGVMGDLTTQAIPVHRGWLKVPKGKQRMGLGDKWVTSFTATGSGINVCQLFTYKEYK